MNLPLRRNLLSHLLFIFFLAGCSHLPHAVSREEFLLPHRVSSEKAVLSYQLLSYPKANLNKKFPLFVILHGQGMSGESYLKIWEDSAVENHFMIYAPTWSGIIKKKEEAGLLYPAIQEVIENYSIDKENVYLVGLSAGGLLAQELAFQKPELWKALIFIASAPGFRREGDLASFCFPPTLIVHGQKDTQFSAAMISQSVNFLQRHHVPVRILNYPEGGHEHRPEWNNQIFEELKKISRSDE